ncbi:MAG: deiodinase-like protein [Pseudomonadales bacterium]
MSTSTGYLYEHLTPRVLMEDMAFSESAPRPGQRLPAFELPSVDGGTIRSADFTGKRPLLLITGSLTCPMTASANPLLKDLHRAFGSQIAFVTLHVREAHPGEQHEQPRTLAQKMAHARQLKLRDRLPWPIVVDDTDGLVHRALDRKPNAVYLTDRNGVIIYRGLWAGDAKGLTRALESAARDELPAEQESLRRLRPLAMGVGMLRGMTEASGLRAQRDLWRAAPPVAVVAWLAHLFRPMQPQLRTVAAAAAVSAAAAIALSMAIRRHRNTRRRR